MNQQKWTHRSLWLILFLNLSLGSVPAQSQLDRWFALPDPAEEISGAAATDLDDRVIMIRDEDRRNLYDYNFRDGTLTLLPFSDDAATEINDLEGLTRRPDGAYFMMASQSRNSSCQIRDARLRLGGFYLVDDGAGNFSVQDYLVRGDETDALRFALIERLPEGAVRMAAELNLPKEGGLDIEALAFVPGGATPAEVGQDALLLGLRGPLTGTPAPDAPACRAGRSPGQGNAFYFYLLNPDAYLMGEDPRLAGPYTVNLDNQGFRDAIFITTQEGTERLLIVAGNTGGGGNPQAYLLDTRYPTDVPQPIALPPGSGGRGIEGAAVLTIDGVARLTLYEDKGAGVPSDVVITTQP